jgi:hypothetical protein
MSTLYKTVLEMKKLLGSLDRCLDLGTAHAAAKKFDADVLLGCRLAPDMFPLIRQVQIACDQAKFAAARTAGKDPPSNPDTEKTMADAKARIATTIAYLDTFTAADFDGAADRTLALPRWEGRSMSALDYFLENALPNFFFHVTTAYAILRHNGVDLAKKDFLGPLPFR